MPSAGVLAAAALAAMGYLFIGQPIAHGVKRAGHAVAKVVHHKPKQENSK